MVATRRVGSQPRHNNADLPHLVASYHNQNFANKIAVYSNDLKQYLMLQIAKQLLKNDLRLIKIGAIQTLITNKISI